MSINASILYPSQIGIGVFPIRDWDYRVFKFSYDKISKVQPKMEALMTVCKWQYLVFPLLFLSLCTFIFSCGSGGGGTGGGDVAEVSFTSPVADATEVGINTSITVTFTRNLDCSTVTTDSFILKEGDTKVSGSVSCSGTTAVFSTASFLNPNTTYTVVISAYDQTGRKMRFSWQFRTGTNQDTASPSVINNLSAMDPTENSATLGWTASGDDGSAGTASVHDIRYSTSPITDANWASATQVAGEPAPEPAGTSQTFTVGGLSPATTYYFAMKTADEIPNWSGLSNVATNSTTVSQDATPPSAINNLSASSPTSSSINLSWTAPGDDGTSGTASGYDVRYSASPITDSNWDSATKAAGEPAPASAGATQTFTVAGLSASTTYYFAIKTADEASNWSALSNITTGTTGSGDSGSGDTYYVATNGSDGNTGSIGSPWATIPHAFGSTKPGDTVILRGGTYSNFGDTALEGNVGGTPEQYKTLAAYPGEAAIINRDRGLRVLSPYIRVKGLQFQNSYVFSSGNAEILENKFSGACGYGCINLHGNNFLISGNTIDNMTLTGTLHHGMYIHGGENITVRGNYVNFNSEGYGIHVYEDQNAVAHKNIIIDGNRVGGSVSRSGILLSNPNVTMDGVIIRNNLITNNAQNGIRTMSNIHNLEIYNNTFYANGLNNDSTDADGDISVRFNTTGPITIKNNIFHNPDVHVQDREDSPNITLQNNLYWPSVKNIGVSDSKAVVGDPVFANAGAGDFHVKAGSKAIDTGVSLTQVTADRDGISRPQGTAYDMGAYEYH